MPVEPFENGTRWSKVLQYLIATVYLLAPITYWGWSVHQGESVDMLIWTLVLALTVASAYLVFGTKRMNEALDRAQDIAGEDADVGDHSGEAGGSSVTASSRGEDADDSES